MKKLKQEQFLKIFHIFKKAKFRRVVILENLIFLKRKGKRILTHPISSWNGGRWSGSRSPCANAMSHQMTPKTSHDMKKIMVTTNSVHLHGRSTMVVKMSCSSLIRNMDADSMEMLQTPERRTTRLLVALQSSPRTPWYRLRLRDKRKNTVTEWTTSQGGRHYCVSQIRFANFIKSGEKREHQFRARESATLNRRGWTSVRVLVGTFIKDQWGEEINRN